MMKKLRNYFFILVALIITTSFSYAMTNMNHLEKIKPILPNKPKNYYHTLLHKHHLNQLIKHANNDLEKIEILTAWVSNRWAHDGYNNAHTINSHEILTRAAKGENFRCVEYAIVLSDVLRAIGLPARTLGLRTKDVETRKSDAGHVVTEVYLKKYHKWILADPQFNSLFFNHHQPLSVFEVKDMLSSKVSSLKLHSKMNQQAQKNYIQWLKPYLYFFTIPVSFHNKTMRALFVPLGQKNPRLFQGIKDDQNTLYTNNKNIFQKQLNT